MAEMLKAEVDPTSIVALGRATPLDPLAMVVDSPVQVVKLAELQKLAAFSGLALIKSW
jgi:hypothetical protein